MILNNPLVTGGPPCQLESEEEHAKNHAAIGIKGQEMGTKKQGRVRVGHISQYMSRGNMALFRWYPPLSNAQNQKNMCHTALTWPTMARSLALGKHTSNRDQPYY